MPVSRCDTARPAAAHLLSLCSTARVDRGAHLGRGVVGVVVIAVGLDVLRVVDVAVVALAVVLPDQLPVGLDLVVDLLCDLRPREALRAQDGGQCAPGERRRLGRRARRRSALRRSRNAPAAGKTPPCRCSCMPRQKVSAPLGVVGPLVVGADHALARAAPGRDELRAAVAADVVERAHRAVLAADHDDRVGVDLERQPVAGVRAARTRAPRTASRGAKSARYQRDRALRRGRTARQAPAGPVCREMVRELPLQPLLHPVTMPSDNKNNRQRE